MTTITGKDIAVFRVMTLRNALGLEIKGLTRRGRSVYSIVKDEFGFKGGKQKVYDQLSAWIDSKLAE